MQFQAYFGGTGALMEKLVRQHGPAAFERTPIEPEPWAVEVPKVEEDIAFLPVYRLAGLIKARHISPSELTAIYLERLKRLDPVLLCAVTILEGPAKEAAQEADAEIKAGKYRGPLHGIPWGVEGLIFDQGRADDMGGEGIQRSCDRR